MNVSNAQKKPPCKICINVAFNLYEFALLSNIDMNVRIVQQNLHCKISINLCDRTLFMYPYPKSLQCFEFFQKTSEFFYQEFQKLHFLVENIGILNLFLLHS